MQCMILIAVYMAVYTAMYTAMQCTQQNMLTTVSIFVVESTQVLLHNLVYTVLMDFSACAFVMNKCNCKPSFTCTCRLELRDLYEAKTREAILYSSILPLRVSMRRGFSSPSCLTNLWYSNCCYTVNVFHLCLFV